MAITSDRAAELVSELENYNLNMSNWEEDFISEMGDRDTFSDAEREKILEIHSKYIG